MIEPGPIRSNIGKTAALHARRNIDLENSVHKAYYRRRIPSLERGGGNTLGELGPEAVLKALAHACESRRPRPQYFVTAPTRGMAILKRLAPKRQLHAFLTWSTRKT